MPPDPNRRIPLRFRRRQVEIAVTLIVLALVIYGVPWVVFPGDTLHHEMERYLIDHIAFLFFQVLLVSMLVDGFLQRRARETMLNKLNMIVGAFFSECGAELLGRFAVADARLGEMRSDLLARAGWKPRDYERASVVVTEQEGGGGIFVHNGVTSAPRCRKLCATTAAAVVTGTQTNKESLRRWQPQTRSGSSSSAGCRTATIRGASQRSTPTWAR